MQKEYYIIEMGMIGKYLDFDDALLVKVIPADMVEEFYSLNHEDINDEEEYNSLQRWLIFKNYPGKYEWLIQKQDMCYEDGYWSLDLEDFIGRFTCMTNKKTGESIVRTLYQVIMIKDNMDAVEAKENNYNYTGRTGSQKLLDELGLELVGKDENKYYLVSEMKELPKEKFDSEHDMRFFAVFGEEMATRWEAYAIPYNCEDAPNGMYHVDRIVLCMNGEGESDLVVVRVEKKNYGIYNYLTRELFKFA
jgi:hypothetical protein